MQEQFHWYIGDKIFCKIKLLTAKECLFQYEHFYYQYTINNVPENAFPNLKTSSKIITIH